MSAKSPLQITNDKHGGKAKLVDKLMGLLGAGSDQEEQRSRLASASNAKLLRLLEVGEAIKQKYGSQQKLAQALATAQGRAKDTEYVERLTSGPPGQLLDQAQSLARRSGGALPEASAASAKAAAPKAAKAAAPKAAAAAAPKAAKAAAPKAEKSAEKKPAEKKPAAKSKK